MEVEKRDKWVFIVNPIAGNGFAKTLVPDFRKGLITGFKLTRIFYLSLAHRFRLKYPLKIINNMLRWIKDMPENIMADLCPESCRASHMYQSRS